MSFTPEGIEAVVLEAVRSMLPGFSPAQQDAELMAELGLDSMQVMNLAMEIEDRLDISIPVEVLAEARTLRELVDQLALHAGAAQP